MIEAGYFYLCLGGKIMYSIDQKMLTSILNSIKATVYAKDLTGRFLFVNTEWEEATGLKSKAVVGKTDYELLGYELGEYYWSRDREVIEKCLILESEESLGELEDDKTLLSIKVPILEGDEVIGVCGIGTDITRIKQLQKNLACERDKSEQLLLNVLPTSVAYELMSTGTTHSECFDNVGVLFSDINDFTRISSTLKPERLIEELNDIFTGFDKAIEENNCERIKTIGDAYMAVSGLPVPNDFFADQIVNSATQLICSLKKRAEKESLKWTTTIGIHGGDVVGGIVGTKKYIYDIFGSTVNMAARLQSATKIYDADILISDSIYNQMKYPEQHSIRQIDIVRVKGDGDAIKLYEVFDCDSDDVKTKKIMTLESFNKARQHYINGEFQEAMVLLKACKKINKEDKIFSVYIKRCNTMMRLPANQNWQGISGI